jgi:hypothetical protein
MIEALKDDSIFQIAGRMASDGSLARRIQVIDFSAINQRNT